MKVLLVASQLRKFSLPDMELLFFKRKDGYPRTSGEGRESLGCHYREVTMTFEMVEQSISYFFLRLVKYCTLAHMGGHLPSGIIAAEQVAGLSLSRGNHPRSVGHGVSVQSSLDLCH